MRLSRLRLGLTVSFAVAFLGGLAVLDLSLYGYLRHVADRRLTQELSIDGEELIRFVRAEFAEDSVAGLRAGAEAALKEWPAPPGSYVVLAPDGEHLAERGPAGWLRLVSPTPVAGSVTEHPVGTEDPVRQVVLRAEGAPPFLVAVLRSTEQTAEENEALAWWLVISTPIVLLLALAGGYVLSRRALAPVVQLERAIAGMAPDQLDQRLPILNPADEIDRVGHQFNRLLDRLQESQSQNRQFLRHAAHQIRTPLTLVIGETSLALRQGPADPAPVFRRIQLAAEQMRRRVEELFLIAEARTGEPPSLTDQVESDALVLECAELMRGRAAELGRHLELGEVMPVVFSGNNGLLREAVLELLENALRHGTDHGPVTLSSWATEGIIRLEVASSGPDASAALEVRDPWAVGAERGLGLAVVRWIAEQHRGRLRHEFATGRNRFSVQLGPLAPAAGARSARPR